MSEEFDAFVALVSLMRAAQRRYFRESTLGNLDEAKRLERECDKAIRRITDDESRPLLREPE
jgi:hypothetical protein